MKRFEAEQLDRAAELAGDVDQRGWNANTLPESERRLLCEYWAFSARALLDETLSEPDQMACLWVLHVVKGIARTTQMFVFGLKREHQGDWRWRAKRAAARIAGRQVPDAAARTTPKRRAKDRKPSTSAPPPSFPALAGSTVIAIGGDHDTGVFDRYQDACFSIEWVPGWNVRRIQAAAESIKLGRIDAVIFLADANRHASFDAVRAACKSSKTPLVLGSMGVTALRRALQSLNDLRAGSRASA